MVEMKKLLAIPFAVATFGAVGSSPLLAVQPSTDEALIVATAEAALEAVSNEDMIALTDLMIEGAIAVSVSEREGTLRHSARTRSEERSRTFEEDIVERGFDPEVRISGPVASVWLPYDLYVDGEWSHCGVDVFTLIKTNDGWKIASLVWSAEQPPACREHPDGPPN